MLHNSKLSPGHPTYEKMYRFPNTDGYFIQHPQWIHAGPYQFEEVGSVVSVEEPNGAQQQVVPTSRIGPDSQFFCD